jgi:hypothetical protein
LTEQDVPHYLWVEQPEDFPTALATAPIPKDKIPKAIKRLHLFRNPVPQSEASGGTEESAQQP